MATSKRNVTLGVGVETSGEQGLHDLVDGLRGVGTAAGGSVDDVDRLRRELDALAAATAAKRAAETAARTDAAAARAELNAQADALARLKVSTDAAGKSAAEYQAREQALRQAVVESRIALRDRQAAVAAAANEAKIAAAAEKSLADTIASASRATVTGNTAVGTSVEALKGQLAALRNVALAATGGTLIGSLARDLASTADAYSNLGARIKLVTGEGAAFTSAFAGVQEIAQRTGATLDSVGTLFARVLQAGKDFGLAQRDALALTETINQAVQLSGASAQASDAAITQLIQGLQSGVLRGEEFNSVMEQAPRLAQALAAGLNVTVGELRKLAEQGALTSQAVIQSLQGQSAALAREFETLPPTVDRAMGRLSAAWTVYVGEANKGSGATSAAASAINALAGNLDTLGNLLYGIGKAAVAFQAVKLGAAFLETAAAATATATATAAATAATVANTAATRANAAAQGEAAAASAASAAGAGRLASALGTVKLAALAVVATNLQDIGTWIGESIAKLRGAGKAIEDLERAQRDEAEAARAMASANAASAQALAQATDKALGLNAEAKRLVGTFDGVVTKSGDVADALEKVTKALRLGDLSGIAAAGAALDALALRGAITAEQIKAAMSEALKGDDLVRFETMARAAFDGSAQGARRLQAAIDAIADESLRRAGTSAAELATGFSAATTSAINDVDTLDRTLRTLGTTGEETSRLLSGALDKALTTANTERAVQALIDRWKALGAEGRIAGDALADGLERARKKVDDLKPGIQSLAEAMRAFGLQSRAQLQETADKLGEAYRVIANSADVSLSDQIKAFGRWREAATAASGGVESGQVAVQRVILQNRADVAGLGDEFARAMGKAAAATRDATAALQEQGKAAAGIRSAMAPGITPLDQWNKQNLSTIQGAQYDAQGFAVDASGQRITAGTQLTPPDSSGNWQFVPDASYGAYQRAEQSAHVVPDVGYWQRTSSTAGGGFNGTRSSAPAPSPAPAPAPALQPARAPTSHTVTINLAGRATTINTATAGDADALAGVLRDLESAASRSATA